MLCIRERAEGVYMHAHTHRAGGGGAGSMCGGVIHRSRLDKSADMLRKAGASSFITPPPKSPPCTPTCMMAPALQTEESWGHFSRTSCCLRKISPLQAEPQLVEFVLVIYFNFPEAINPPPPIHKGKSSCLNQAVIQVFLKHF